MPVKHSAGFLTETGSINVGHPEFKANTVHRCMENHILTAQNRQISPLLAFREIKRSKWSLETRAFLIFLSD